MRLKEGGQVQEMTRIDPSLLSLVMDEGGHDPRNGGGASRSNFPYRAYRQEHIPLNTLILAQ